MKWLALSAPILLTCLVAPVMAEKPTVSVRSAPSSGAGFSMSELTPTPEMWFYEQSLRQYSDPKVAVRANAEFRANQRQQRMAALKWYGFSNQRPRASAEVVHSDFSPAWTSGSANYPNRWGGQAATIILAP